MSNIKNSFQEELGHFYVGKLTIHLLFRLAKLEHTT